MATGTEPADPFASPAALRAAFERGLGEMLTHDVLGGFILVLANASLEQALSDRLREPLAVAFERWCERFDRADPRALEAAPDDIEVFRRLRRVGLDRLGVTRWRRAGPWELQFNPLRAFRPPRASGATVEMLRRPFDPAGFDFNRPFLRREILWEGELAGAPVRLLYNKFPFAELHGLLVPDPEAQRPQFLERDAHALLWAICADLGRRLPGVGFGYNAYGAFASVNHLHFQMYVRAGQRYPIEWDGWRHNGGGRPYPLPVQRHDDREAAWSAVQLLHLAGIAYNLLFRPGRVFVVPRAMQGHYRHSDWAGGFAWAETAGALTLSDAAVFERLSTEDVAGELRRLAVTG